MTTGQYHCEPRASYITLNLGKDIIYHNEKRTGRITVPWGVHFSIVYPSEKSIPSLTCLLNKKSLIQVFNYPLCFLDSPVSRHILASMAPSPSDEGMEDLCFQHNRLLFLSSFSSLSFLHLVKATGLQWMWCFLPWFINKNDQCLFPFSPHPIIYYVNLIVFLMLCSAWA